MLGVMTILDNPTWTLSERLRKSRLLADFEQDQLAGMIGVSRNTISNWETGRSEPSATMFVRWAQATGVTLEWLAEGVNAKAAPSEDEAAALCARRDSNPQPSDLWSTGVLVMIWLGLGFRSMLAQSRD